MVSADVLRMILWKYLVSIREGARSKFLYTILPSVVLVCVIVPIRREYVAICEDEVKNVVLWTSSRGNGCSDRHDEIVDSAGRKESRRGVPQEESGLENANVTM